LALVLVACDGDPAAGRGGEVVPDAGFLADGAIAASGDGDTRRPLRDDGREPMWRWDEMAARTMDRDLLAAGFDELSYSPPAGTEIYAAVIVESDMGPGYAMYEWGGGAFAQSFWPASTIKVHASLAALRYVASRGFSSSATVKWASGFTDKVSSIVDRAIRVSSNEDYDRTIRIAGFDELNTVWLSDERGFPTTNIKGGYAGFEVKNPPGYTLTEGAKTDVVPARAAQGTYPCASGKSNCTNLFELTEAVRRVVLRDEVPLAEQFDIPEKELALVESALCNATPSFFADGAKKVLGAGTVICHKPGWVPGLDSLDHGLVTADDGRRFLLAAAIPDPGNSSSQAKLAILAEKTMMVLTGVKGHPFPLQRTTGVPIAVEREGEILRLAAATADGFELFVDGEAVEVILCDDGFHCVDLGTEPIAEKLITVRASRGNNVVGVRNLVL
ncbi:MAG: hypothetical protein KC416_04905, partial [Myxococcales bacterium]|nr:hypothetical protein [Myxococcales bacterium]